MYFVVDYQWVDAQSSLYSHICLFCCPLLSFLPGFADCGGAGLGLLFIYCWWGGSSVGSRALGGVDLQIWR